MKKQYKNKLKVKLIYLIIIAILIYLIIPLPFPTTKFECPVGIDLCNGYIAVVYPNGIEMLSNTGSFTIGAFVENIILSIIISYILLILLNMLLIKRSKQ